jgi:hypothetical protein
MKSKKNNTRRDFIKQSALAAAGLTILPGVVFGKDGTPSLTREAVEMITAGQSGMKTVAFITNIYRNRAHGDAIGTALFLGMSTDDGIIAPQIKIVSVWIDQIGKNDTGVRIATMNGAKMYPTIEEALTLGGDKLAVDAVVYVGEHGEYKTNRFGEVMYPRMNYLERIFRVFDASNKSVPLFSDKHLSYSYLDSMWIYNRAKELNVPMMAGSTLPLGWRNPQLEHPLGTKITEAVAIGYSTLESYGFHTSEILQCMVERRAGGETGIASIMGYQGNDVWKAIDSGKISKKLVDAALERMGSKVTGPMREVIKMPYAISVQYNDGTKGTVMMLHEYGSWAYAAVANGKMVSTQFILGGDKNLSHFSYLALNIQKMILTGKPTTPIERTLYTSCILDLGIRSMADGKLKKTPFLNIKYSASGYEPIRSPNTEPTKSKTNPFPPKGYEFITR